MLSNNESTTAQASELGGQTVAITSGAYTRIVGSNVLADQRLDIKAGGNLSIEAAQNTSAGSTFNETKKSGLFGSGGIGFTIGKQQQSTDAQNTQTTAAASTVGAIAGDVNLNAGQTYTQRGSDVLAPGGDVNISAQRVTIEEARETANSQTEQKAKQSGLTVAVNVPIVQSAQALAKTVEAAGDTKSERMQLLGAATAALQAKELADQAGKLGDALAKGTDMAQAADISVSVSLGSSKSQSNSSQSSDSARGSSVTAGGDVNITARGAGANSDITIQGSTVKADGTTRLSAEDEVKLLAARNTQTEANSQSSRSGSVGLTFATSGISATASASRGQGQGAGDGTTYTNTQISGQSVQITSGGDTTLKGAVVQGEQVAVNVGGNLNIESQQDSSRYNETSKSAGFSVSVPITGANASVSVNAGKTNINSNYNSVGEQTAIRAGDGGFQVNVAGNTTLTGGAITSSDKAVQDGKNTFSTAGQTAAEAINSGALTLTDLSNSASFEASGVNIGVGVSRGEAKDPQGNTLRNPDGSAQTKTTPNNSAGFGQTDGAASSTTVAAISGLAGNTAARTGDAETGIKPIFNKDEVKQEINAQIAITAEFGQRASKMVGDHADTQLAEANRKEREADQAKANGDNARAEQLQAEANAIKDNWGDSGKLRLAAHTAIGALTGGTSGAVGAASGTLTAPLVADALRKAGVDETLTSGLTALASTAVGAATGGSAGAAAAFNEVTNNYLSHSEQQRLKNAKAACVGGNANACSEQNELEALDKKRDDDYANAYDQCRATKNCKALLNLDNQMGRDMEWAGNLSKHYESKGDPGAINAKQLPDGTWVLPTFKDGSKDPGGFSYGSYQIETQKGTMRDFMNYLKGSDPASYQALQAAGGHEAAKAGSPTFIQAWQSLARDTGFAEQQHQFIDLRKYQSAYSYAKTLIPNLDQRSEVLKEIIWSGAVQHGQVNNRVLKPAWENSANATDEQLIKRFFSQRLDYSRQIKGLPDMSLRYEAELNKALDWLKKPRTQWR